MDKAKLYAKETKINGSIYGKIKQKVRNGHKPLSKEDEVVALLLRLGFVEGKSAEK